MKILVALIAIALAAALLCLATMGADTLVPGGDSAKKQAAGPMNVADRQGARHAAGLSRRRSRAAASSPARP